MRRLGSCLLVVVCSGCTSLLGDFGTSSGDGGADASGLDATTDQGAEGSFTDSGPGESGLVDSTGGQETSTHDGGSDGSRSDASSDGPPGDAQQSGCVIGGTTYASGAVDPTNACQSCQPSISTSQFSPLLDGTTCTTAGSGDICHTGTCVSGCEIGTP